MERLEQTRADAEAPRSVSAEGDRGVLRRQLARGAEPFAPARRAFNGAPTANRFDETLFTPRDYAGSARR